MPVKNGHCSEVQRARMSAAAQERAYWTRLFNHVRRAADAGEWDMAHDLLDDYLEQREAAAETEAAA